MFVTLAGGYPRVGVDQARASAAAQSAALPDDRDRAPVDRAAGDRAVDAVLAELAAIGLEPLSDGEVRWADPAAGLASGLDGLEGDGAAVRPGAGGPETRIRAVREPAWSAPITVDDWRYAASRTDRAVKQALVGPYTLGRRLDPGELGRERVTLALAEALNAELLALAAAGCPLVEVHEDAAVEIGPDEAERRLFAESQRRLLDGVADGLHCTLAIRGGNADTAGSATILDPPYRSLLVDLIGGPDNWRLVAAAPADRGIVCGVMDVRAGRAMGVEVLIFAARHAAATRGRGLVRVGLAPAGSMAHLEPGDARSRLELLVRAAELATSSPETIGRSIDPRAVDIRSAALGRYAPAGRRPPGPVAPEVLQGPGATGAWRRASKPPADLDAAGGGEPDVDGAAPVDPDTDDTRHA